RDIVCIYSSAPMLYEASSTQATCKHLAWLEPPQIIVSRMGINRMLCVSIIDDGINHFFSKPSCSWIFAILYVDFIRYIGDFFSFMYLNLMLLILLINRKFRCYTNSYPICNRLNEHFIIIQINTGNILNTDKMLIH